MAKAKIMVFRMDIPKYVDFMNFLSSLPFNQVSPWMNIMGRLAREEEIEIPESPSAPQSNANENAPKESGNG